MYKTLFILAKQNIKKYKKHYLIVSIIIFLVSTIMFFYVTFNENNNQLVKEYNIATYGNWYTTIPAINESPETQIGIETYSHMYFKDEVQYGYVKNQGNLGGYLIGHIDDSIYDLCRINIIDGRKLTQDNEILVSDQYAKKENVRINDYIKINDVDYTVVGITHTNNEGFPDIYTNLNDFVTMDYYSNMELGIDGIIGYYDETDECITLSLNYSYNKHGYDYNEINVKVDDSLIVISTFFEIIVIVLFILLALTSSSLKKRKKEMALLRGIGMTTSQLVIMILYENMIVSILSLLSGFILGLIISLGSIYYQSTIYQMFIYKLNIQTIIISFILLICCVFISAIIPIISSSKNALTGNFDSQKFKYIQVRYKKLKKQTLSYLASRELKVNKKINLCFFIFVVVISIYGLVCFYNEHPIRKYDSTIDISKNYVSVSTYHLEVIDEFVNKFPEDTFSYKTANDQENIELQYANLKNSSFKEFGLLEDNQFNTIGQVKGKIPTKSHEIMVTKNICEMDLSREDYPDIFQNIDDSNWYSPVEINGKTYSVTDSSSDDNNKLESLSIEVDMLQIGESIYINNEEYKVTGILIFETGIESYDYPSIFLFEDDFSLLFEQERISLESKHYFENSDSNDVLTFLKGKNNGENGTLYNNNVGYDIDQEQTLIGSINVEYLLAVIFIGFIISLFLNYNNIENNYQDYQMYHILGMSYQEIKKKQLWKSLHMTCITAIPIILYSIILIIFSIDQYVAILETLGILLAVMIFYFTIYNLPLYLVLNNHKNEELRNGDE